MIALTMWEPWASLVAYGVKQLETRDWSTRHRGPVAIHASKRDDFGRQVITRHDFIVMREALRNAGMRCVCGCVGDAHSVTFGCLRCECIGYTPAWSLGQVIATVDLVDVLPMVPAHRAMTGRFGGESVLGVGPALEQWRAHEEGSGAVYVRSWQSERPFGWFAEARFAFVLERPTLLDLPVPARGRQKLWHWSGDVDVRAGASR